ncbi:MAG: hypothetical protein NTY74_11130 [Ignavibacteriae bacterium]|nr:hypothetical protein [Ignavibacteriota bacterium]
MKINFKLILFFLFIIAYQTIPLLYNFIDVELDSIFYRQTAIEWFFKGINFHANSHYFILNPSAVTEEMLHYARFKSTLLVIYPITIFIKLFGLNNTSIILFSVICNTSVLILTFIISYLLYKNLNISILSVIILILTPTFNYFNGSLLADGYALVYFLLPITISLYALLKKPKLTHLLLLLSGILSSISLLGRPWSLLSIAITYFFIFYLNDVKQLPIKKLIFTTAGTIIGGIIILIIAKLISDNYFHFFKIYYDVTDKVAEIGQQKGGKITEDLFVFWKSLIDIKSFSFMAVAVLFFVLTRNNTRNDYVLLLPILFCYIAMEFILRTFFSLTSGTNYISFIMPFIAIYIGKSVKEIYPKNKLIYISFIFAIAIVSLCQLISYYTNYAILDTTLNQMQLVYDKIFYNWVLGRKIHIVLFFAVILLIIFKKRAAKYWGNIQKVRAMTKVVIIMFVVSSTLFLAIKKIYITERKKTQNEIESIITIKEVKLPCIIQNNSNLPECNIEDICELPYLRVLNSNINNYEEFIEKYKIIYYVDNIEKMQETATTYLIFNKKKELEYQNKLKLNIKNNYKANDVVIWEIDSKIEKL